METKVVSRDSFFDKFSENFTWMDSEKDNRIFAGGGGHNVPPPLVFGAQKSLVGIGLRCFAVLGIIATRLAPCITDIVKRKKVGTAEKKY